MGCIAWRIRVLYVVVKENEENSITIFYSLHSNGEWPVAWELGLGPRMHSPLLRLFVPKPGGVTGEIIKPNGEIV